MTICVCGLWHTGCVTAACLAGAGLDIIGLDPDGKTIADLKGGRAPLYEPGLDEVIAAGIGSGKLSFTTDMKSAVGPADLVWVTFDTPVDETDHGEVGFVVDRTKALFPYLKDGSALVVSSQMPVGSVRRLAEDFAALAQGRRVGFACVPENLRLGKAIDAFRNPDRVIIGTADETDGGIARDRMLPIVAAVGGNAIWVSIESAEMIKHAINAFLATSVTFINEIATVCEQVGADSGEVERGLRSEPRIGAKAYIRPGAAFAGGTLARDLKFLLDIAADKKLSLPLLGGVIASNSTHARWALRRLEQHLGPLRDRRIAILGLSYKPGTDAVRRSMAIELCRDLTDAGAHVTSFDPVVRRLPDDLAESVTLAPSAEAAATGAEALVIATEWPDFKALSADLLALNMAAPLVIDQNRLLASTLGADSRIRYVSMGRGV